ncbi:S8 family serine peptidase [Kribbella sp. DT2]|uniref:S8 family serine peptidase n=1 Tax=Kribbella sp. DT2 TaxID=3393427 RepID=UPI003CFA2D1C
MTGLRWGMAGVLVLGLGVVGPGAAAAQEEAGRDKGRAVSVTLITGDRVTVRGGDEELVSVEPGPGRRQVKFRTARSDEGLSVVPADQEQALGSGLLDPRLFSVTTLAAGGLDDVTSDEIPLLVTYQASAPRAALAGAKVVRELPVINGSAVRVAKSKAAAFTAQRNRGVAKIWLDGRRKISLDRSVAQIGAPAAWQAGYTGKNVRVAVLDTGVDATHPDLAGQVAAARNFTSEAADDLVGHGTHVASTIAGTGAGYRGVAPDAKVLDAKVCGVEFCSESAIIAGMEWAAREQRAQVINVSLGGPDDPGIDPVEATVGTLTAETGALFVVAAGNAGPEARTVDSPGSADAALTVGATDRSDRTAIFSSRGPRVGDGGIKPDLSAPGVGIVAARAAKAIIGTPVGDRYLQLSGTSMAAPHVAGAAALLAEQHTAWRAAELKGALTASAEPSGSVFEQGSGRVDVARAITSDLSSVPTSLSFGATPPPPAAEPLVRELTYRNPGSTAITLDLTGSLAGPDGGAPRAVRFGSPRVTVPAGGSATVEVIVDTDFDGPAGHYTGRVTATSGTTRVITPIAMTKTGRMHVLTVKHLGPDGAPIAGQTGVHGPTGMDHTWIRGSETSVRLAEGEYVLDGLISIHRTGLSYDRYELVDPSFVLDRDTTVVVDARQAKPVGTKLPRAEVAPISAHVGWVYAFAEGGGFSGGVANFEATDGFDGIHVGRLGDAEEDPLFSATVSSQWAVPGTDGSFNNSPVFYGLVQRRTGSFWDGYQRTVKDSELAKVITQQNGRAGQQVFRMMFGLLPGMSSGVGAEAPFDLPSTSTAYVEAEARWPVIVEQVVPDPDPEAPWPSVVSRWYGDDQITYRSGKTYRERWNAAAFGPLFTRASPATRTGNRLEIFGFAFADQDGHGIDSMTDTAQTELYRDGELISRSDDVLAVAATAPSQPAWFELRSKGTRPPSTGDLTPEFDARWTFRSQDTGDQTVQLPLPTVRYRPAVDATNQVRRTPVSKLPLEFVTSQGPVDPKKVELQVSGDDGRSWQPAKVVRSGRSFVAVFRTPPGATSVSLKVKATAADQSTAELSTIRAYGLKN